MAKFKKEVLELMKTDPSLFIKLCHKMNIKAVSMPMTIDRNGNNLNQYDIVTLVASHLGKLPEQLLEEEIKEETELQTVNK